MTASLRTEINKRLPFDSLEQEVYLNLARTRSVLEEHTLRVLKEHKLTESSYNVLRILRGWRRRADEGDETARPNGGRTCTEIAGDMVVRASDITRLIDRLEKMDLVRRERAPDDGRAVLVFLTEDAEQLLRELDSPVSDAHRAQLGHLDAADLQLLNDLLTVARKPHLA